MFSKTKIFALVAMLVSVVVFLSCSNFDELLPESREEPLMVLEGRSHAGVTVVKNSNYGNYLSLKTTKTMENVTIYLDRLERDEFVTTGNTELDKWEQGLSDFVSLRMQEKLTNVPFERQYVNRSISTLLNKNGYIMIDGILYHDDGKEVNIVNMDGTKKLYFTQNTGTVDKKTAKSPMECSGFGDMSSSAQDFWCGNFGYTFRLKGVMNHYHSWIPLTDDKLYVTIINGVYDCLGNRAYPVSNLSFTFSYTGTRNGASYSIFNGNTNINTNSTSYQTVVAQGRNICFDSVKIQYRVTTSKTAGNVPAYSALSTTTIY